MATCCRLAAFAENFPKVNVDELLELLRQLRDETTSADGQLHNRSEISCCLTVLSLMIDWFSGANNDNVIDRFVLSVCCRVAVQFLGNAIVDNPDNQTLLWNQPQVLRKAFFYDDRKLNNYTCMIYYNLMLTEDQGSVREAVLTDRLLLDRLLDQAILGLSEYPQFVVERLLRTNSLKRLYHGDNDEPSPVHRSYLLDVICSLLKSSDFVLDSADVLRISEDYKKRLDALLVSRGGRADGTADKSEDAEDSYDGSADKTNGTPNKVDGEPDRVEVLSDSTTDKEDPDSVEVLSDSTTDKDEAGLTTALLSALCCISSHDIYRKIICDDKSLLITSIYGLRAVSMAFQEKRKRLEDTPSTAPLPSSTLTVAIGFKANLIRLIGNLCFRHRVNQDLVRENRCIEVMLDSCKLDEDNPFVIEWVVLAMRNLCEDNIENQQLIDSLRPLSQVQPPSSASHDPAVSL